MRERIGCEVEDSFVTRCIRLRTHERSACEKITALSKYTTRSDDRTLETEHRRVSAVPAEASDMLTQRNFSQALQPWSFTGLHQ